MDKENLDYLNSISDRVIAYDDVRAQVVEFLLNNKISDVDLATDLFIMGFLWEAHHREETLTDDDLIMFLDGDDDLEPIEYNDQKEYILEDDQAEMDLVDLLELTVKNHNG